MKYSSFFLVTIIFCGCFSKPTVDYDLVIQNVNLIDGTGKELLSGVSIGIKEGRILTIDNQTERKATQTIDGSGKYLIPGLFDCHVHTGDYDRDFPRFIHYGVTSIFITGGSLCTNEWYAEVRERGNQDSIPAPYVFHTSQHFTMEGRHPAKTYTSSNWRDGISLFYLKDTMQIASLVKQVAQFPIVGIKLTIEDGPAPPMVERMPQEFVDKTVKEAAKYGLEVFAHTSDNTELEMAINAGVQNLVHFTGMDIDPQDSSQVLLLKKFKEKDPYWVTTLMIDKSFLYPLHPEWFKNEAMLPEYQNAVTKITPWDKKRGKIYLSILKEQYNLKVNDMKTLISPQVSDVKYLYEEGFNMVLGTDTGNKYNFAGYSLHEEMQLLEMGGMDALDIFKMGSLNAAEMVGAQDSLGSIEVGKIANMVLLDRNPLESINNTLAINTVIKNGVIQERVEVVK